MMYPSSFPFETPENIFFGIQFDVEPSEVHEHGGQVRDQVTNLSRFDYFVINIDDNCWFWPLDLVRLVKRVNLIGEALLHASLIGGASVLQTERHDYVTV